MYYYYQDVIARLLKNHKGIKKLLVVPIIIGILMLPYAQSFLVYGQSMVNSLASEEPASDEVFVETNTIEIEHRELESIITTTGIIKSDIETTLASKNPGRITQVYFDTGDRVQKGQVIARLGGEEHSAQLQMAQNAYSNTNDLYTHSQSMYEQQVKNAENQVLTAQANLGALEVEQQNLEEIRKEQKAGALIQYEIAETYEDHIRDIGHEEYDASPPEMQGLVDEKYDLEIENAELQLDYADSQLDLLDVNLNAQANTLNAQIDVAETYLRQAEDGVITAERQSLSQLQMIKTQLDNAQDNIALASVMVENNVI